MLSDDGVDLNKLRVIEKVEKHLNSLSIDYEHYTPAVYLTENGALFNKLDCFNESLLRFENLFREINKLVK
jgi:hypothetical protein